MAKHQTKLIFLHAHDDSTLELQLPKPGAAEDMIFAVPDELPALWKTIVDNKRSVRCASLFLPLDKDEAVSGEIKRESKAGKQFAFAFTAKQVAAHAKRNPVAFVLSYGNFGQPRLDVHLTERKGRPGAVNKQANTSLVRAEGNIAADPREKQRRVSGAIERAGVKPTTVDTDE